MTSLCHPSRLVASGLVLACLLAASSASQGYKLNGPLARPVGGDIQIAQVSADGERVVYTADEETDDVFELFSVKSASPGTRVRIAGPVVEGGDVHLAWIGPRGRHVVFVGDLEVDEFRELYSVPIEGGPIVKLASPTTGIIDGVTIDPSERLVIYHTPVGSTVRGLFSVPIVGGASLRLDAPGGYGGVSRSLVSPDGRRVVYVSDEGSADRAPGLFSVPIQGGSPVRLSLPATEVRTTNTLQPGFWIDGRSSRVLFLAKAIGVHPIRWRLYSAPLDGSGPTIRLHRSPVSESSVRVGADGKRAVMVVMASSGFEFVSVPVDGSPGIVTLFRPSAGQTVRVPELTPDGRFVLFEVNGAIHRAPIDGTAPSVEIAANAGGFAISPDSRFVVYQGLDALGEAAIFTVPIDLSMPAVRIADGGGYLSIAPDSSRVVCQASFWEDWNRHDVLFSVPILGGAAVPLTGPMPYDGRIEGVHLTPFNGGSVVYRATQVVREQFELFSAPLDGSSASVRLNGQLTVGPVEGDVEDMALTPDATRVVYRADQDTDGIVELYSVRTGGPAQPVKLSVPLEAGHFVARFAIAPDGARVVYWIEALLSPRSRLMVVSIEGGASVQLAEWISDHGFLFDPAGERIVVQQEIEGSYPDRRIVSLRLDGSAAPLELAPGSQQGEPTPLTSDLRVLYRAPSGLFIVPIDASATALQLVAAPSFGALNQPVLDAAGTRAVFTGDLVVDQRTELFSVLLDGSAPAVRLTPTLPNFRHIRAFRAAADGRVYFVGDLLDNGRTGLFRVPSDGSAPPARLNAPLPSYGEVAGFDVSIAAGRVVYVADQEADALYQLFSVPLDGGEAPRKLSAELHLGNPWDHYNFPMFRLSLDGERVVLRSGRRHLFSAPTDGSSAPIRISADAPLWDRIPEFRLAPDGSTLVYSTGSYVNGFALFHAPIDASGRARRVSGVAHTGEEGPAFEFGARADWIVFRSDQETYGVFELFLSVVKEKWRGARLR